MKTTPAMKLVLLILVYIVLCTGCIYPAAELQVPEPIVVEQEYAVLNKSDNATVANVAVSAMPKPIPFNVSISFDGMNRSKNKIVVEIPSFVINSTPMITCGNTKYSPDYVIPGNISTYFYECECLSGGLLVFGEHTVPFFVLGEGDGWDFSRTHSTNLSPRSAVV